MTIIEVINSIPKIFIWLMALILVGYFLVWIINKFRNKENGEVYDEFIEDPKDELRIPEVPYEEVIENKTLSKGSYERMMKK